MDILAHLCYTQVSEMNAPGGVGSTSRALTNTSEREASAHER